MENRFVKLARASGFAMVMLAATSAHAAPLVNNGGFETGDFFGWSCLGCIPGYSGVDGVHPHSGSWGAYFGNSSIYIFELDQEIATTPGTTYSISFWLRTDSTTSPNMFDAVFGSGGISLNNVSTFNYTEYSFSAVATAVSTTLSFTFQNSTAFFDFDDVSVEAVPSVPLPAALPLFATGLGALGLLGWRKKKNAAARVTQ